MRVARLSIILFVVGLAATVGLLVLGIWAVAQVRAYQVEIQGLVALQGRANDISATSDALLLEGAGGAAYDAFRDEARALQADLSQLGGRSASLERAVRAIDDMLGLADAYAGPGGEGVTPSAEGESRGRFASRLRWPTS